VETLAYYGLVGNRPECVIVGVEPKEYTAYRDLLTPMIQEKMEHIIREVLKEVAAAGGTYSPRVPERPAAVQEK
jgi:hydrogenase maturation protease